MGKKLRCRFCNRKIAVTKYTRHSCNDKKIARANYGDWQHEHRDDKSTIDRFPTFEAWDRAILDGTVVYPQYPYSPGSIEATTYGESDLDSDGDAAVDDFGNEGLVLEQGTEWTGAVSDAQPVATDGGFIRPSDQDVIASKTPAEEGEKTTLKDTAEAITSGAIDVSKALKISLKEKGWLPIVAGVHELIMWTFDAKRRNVIFRLSKQQKKILCASYQATLGDSPLLKLKTTGQGEYDVHIAVGYIEVYGEFCMANVEGAIGRGKGLWKIWGDRQERKKKEKKVQEKIEQEVQELENGKTVWETEK